MRDGKNFLIVKENNIVIQKQNIYKLFILIIIIQNEESNI